MDVPSERPGPNNNVPAGVRGASLGPGARGCELDAAVWLGTKFSSQTAVMDLLADAGGASQLHEKIKEATSQLVQKSKLSF